MQKGVAQKKERLSRSFLRITLAVLLIVTTLISVVMYLYTKNIVYKDLTSYLYSTQNEMCKSMELIINDVNMASVRLLSERKFYQIINDKTVSDAEKERLIKEQLASKTKEYDIIGEVVIVTSEGKAYRMTNDYYVSLPEKRFLDSVDNSSTVAYIDGIAHSKDGEAYIMMGRKLRNLDTGRSNGYLILYLKSSDLIKVYGHMLIDDSFSMLVNSNGMIISAEDKSAIGKTIFNFDFDYSGFKSKALKEINYKDEKMVVAKTLFSKQLNVIGFDWQVLTYINQKNVQAIAGKVNYNIWVISSISLVVAVVLSFITVAYILRPLRILQSAMKGFKGVRQDIKVSSRAYDEIWELEKAYGDMVYRIDELIIKNNEEKEKQRELELSALQAQINPHFLYNTLDAIVWLAKIKKQQDIEKITMALAKFFRMSLHKGDKFITVSEEISLVQSFVVIEQMRFPNQLQISYNIAEDLSNYYILKLILQPIVENALKHGIREKRENGRIEINGMKYDDTIILEVIDNGKGFNPQMLDEFDNIDKSKSVGYGLKNVDERIKLEYGKKYGISIYSQLEKGTTVVIKIGIKGIAQTS